MKTLLLPVVALALLVSSATADTPVRDTFSDTWVAADGLGRRVPTSAEVGAPRAGRTVAIFYFLWLGRSGEEGPFDVSKILQASPNAMNEPDNPLWGPKAYPHHWGESIFGYYRNDDPAVLRKHAQMLADAGVDAVIFDVTNQLTYPESWKALCETFDAMRRQGLNVPKIAFLTPFWQPKKVVTELYDQLYAPGLYPELWLRWEGKPLILADPALLGDDLPAGLRDGFTFRAPQPDYFAGPTKPAQWSWLEVHPQHAFPDEAGHPEQVSVGVAQNAVDGKLGVMSHPHALGRSATGGQPPSPESIDFTGKNIAEQWRRARELDPPFVFVTGWNEWIAGRFDQTFPLAGSGPVTFVDQFDREHSRDIEPMVGGHGDAFYYQLVSEVRRYKGARPVPAVVSRPIAIDGQFDDWQDVSPEFRDTIGDPMHRDFPGWGRTLHYVNRSGRNDLVAAKASRSGHDLAFLLECASPIESSPDRPGPVLFLDTDRDPSTGWLGYDFVVGRTPGAVTIERNVAGGFEWSDPKPVSATVAGNRMELAIPWTGLGLEGTGRAPLAIDFKWSDNLAGTGDWSDFTLHGDSAPNDRFNYRAEFAPE
jgi:hypothetical protein